MSDGEALLRGVIAAPDDDLPRLVYADWLDEHDDPARAEVIRVQCALEGLPPGDPSAAELRARERVLLRAHGWVWADALGANFTEWVYRRGFIERVEMSLEVSRDEIVATLGKAPIRHVRDTGQFNDLAGVVEALPDLAHLTGLEFWGLYGCDDALYEQLVLSPHLANLRTLILHHDRNGDTAPDALVVAALQSPHRANLEELAVNVDGSWRGPSVEVLHALAESPYLRKLRKLNLSNVGGDRDSHEVDAKLARRLGQSPNLAGLEDLDLSGAACPLDVWDEVLKWPCLPRLKTLRLHGAWQVGPNGHVVAYLAEVPEYRQAIDRLVPAADWVTEDLTPYSGDDACWHGQKRERRRY